LVRAVWKFLEVGFRFSRKAAFPPVPPGEVVEHGGIACQLLNASLTVELCVEASLDHSQCPRLCCIMVSPLHLLILESVERHHPVYQSISSASCACVLTAEEPDLAGLFLTTDAGEVGGAEAGVEAGPRGAVWPKMRIGGDGKVTNHVEHMAAAIA
jgi:hypothetical protein